MAQISIFFILITILPCIASVAPGALVAPITKDPNTSLYTLTLGKNHSFVIDVLGNLLWFPCHANHSLIRCSSHKCAMAHSFQSQLCPPIIPIHKKQCTCVACSVNSVTKTCAFGDLTYTNLTISTTDGRTPIGPVTIPSVVSTCVPKTLLRSLPAGAAGVVGLSRARIALPTQMTEALSLERKFAICLPSTSTSTNHGVAFFGSGPFVLRTSPELDVTSILSYVPLIKNPMTLDYCIHMNAIAVNGEIVRFLSRMLDFDALGHGGVMLSTTIPYTTLRTHVYMPFLKAFAAATKGIPRAPKVKPFDLCLNTSSIASTPVPHIDLMLANGKNWTIFGPNSMKLISDDAACLAIIDGGARAERAVVIGSFQLEDNFLLFDLHKKRLGFSSTLNLFSTSCANFNFSSGV